MLRWSHVMNSQVFGRGNSLLLISPIYKVHAGQSLKIISTKWNPHGNEIVVRAEIEEAQPVSSFVSAVAQAEFLEQRNSFMLDAESESRGLK